MTQEHINAAFDEDLDGLDKLITTMGNLALSQFCLLYTSPSPRD